MKLEELRQRLREPKLARQAPKPRSRKKKRKEGRTQARGADFGVRLFVDDAHDAHDEETLLGRCARCRHRLADHGSSRCRRCACKGFLLSFVDDEKARRCAKCGRIFTPDPKLPYVPNVCASCESYL